MPCVQAHVACADLSSRRQPCARAGARLRALLRYCGPKPRKRVCSGTRRSVGLHFLASRGADCSIEHRAPCVAARQPMPFQMASPSSQCPAAGSRARAWELLGCCRPAKSRRHRLSRPAFSGLAGPSQEERPPTRMHARPHLCAFVRLDTCMLARTPHSLARCTHARTHARTAATVRRRPRRSGTKASVFFGFQGMRVMPRGIPLGWSTRGMAGDTHALACIGWRIGSCTADSTTQIRASIRGMLP
jgi:hypothetical protein